LEKIALRFLGEMVRLGTGAHRFGSIRNNFTSPVKVPEMAFVKIYRHGMRLPVSS
jgi:hypothetical protein